MVDWRLIGQYVLLFLADGVAGYFLQFVGYTLAIHAFNKRRVAVKPFFSMTIIFTVFAILIRNIPYIKFGYHTIFTAIICVILSCKVFKSEIYPTVLAVLLSVVSIFVNAETITELIYRALLGIPANILLLIEMFMIYKYYLKKVKEDGLNRAIGKNDNL